MHVEYLASSGTFIYLRIEITIVDDTKVVVTYTKERKKNSGLQRANVNIVFVHYFHQANDHGQRIMNLELLHALKINTFVH